ncbi:MAG TPA: monovalent cation/H(+) antiporter subunit G [Thermohalobaculum sp.]|nr:monovalent cation/H(+) antiporter subunit G [Thermohalobaculum sp.]
MATVIDTLSWAALLGGSFFYVVGAIGLNRMPDIFTRMHAVSVSETLGVGLLILGMALQAGVTLITVKLIIIMVVMMWTGAVATHALARAALHDGEKPLLVDETGNLVRTDPVSLFPELGVRLAAPLSSEVVDEAPYAVPMGADGPITELPDDSGGDANRDARPPDPGKAD